MGDIVDERVTELLVRIIAGSEPVRGLVGPSDGPGAEFSGWSEFAAIIERFRHGAGPRGREDADA